MVLLQGIFQVLGVASIFPFLALVSDPDRLAESRFTAAITERFPGFESSDLILNAGIGAVAMLLISNAINMVSEFTRTYYSLALGQWLRVYIMRKIASREYAYFLETNPSLLMKKIGADVAGFISGVFLPILDVLVRVVCLFLMLVLLFFVNVNIAIGSILIFGSVYVALLWVLKARMGKISNELKEINREAGKALYQFVAGMKVILVQNKSEFFISGYDSLTRRHVRLSAIIPVVSNFPRYLIEPLAFGGLVVVVMVLSAQDRDFQSLIPVLGVMAFAGYRMLPALQFLYGGLTGIIAQKHCLEEIRDEIEGFKPIPSPTNASRNSITFSKALEARDVSFLYRGSSQPVLRKICFTLPKGGSLGIVGSTGSGKSTLIDLIMGLHNPVSGTFWVDDQCLEQENIRGWREKIGYVPQDIFLLDDSVAENIAFGVPSEKIDRKRLREAASAAQILEFIETELPGGFACRVGDRGVRLSGGQRQRIGLARALYDRPEVLVLDEATSALDNRTESDLMRAVESLGRNITLIMVAHRMTTVQKCDKIILLEDGCIRAQGTFEELRAGDPAFQRLVLGD